MSKSREWIVSDDGRCFEVQNDQFFIEHNGEPPKNPIHVIEYSAFEEMKERAEKAELEREFIKQYLNPADTSFREMMNIFVGLPEDKKIKLIDLARSLADLAVNND